MKENTFSILLVNEDDTVLGTAEKEYVHRHGLLHRAFSIFLFNNKGELLIHKRADSKYHSPGVWTNTCCSHQSTEDDEMQYIHRRLLQEMGVDAELTFLFKHKYSVQFDNGLMEYEYDHVYFGVCSDTPSPDPAEVSDWRWSECDNLLRDMDNNPAGYSYWFRELLPLVCRNKTLQKIIL